MVHGEAALAVAAFNPPSGGCEQAPTAGKHVAVGLDRRRHRGVGGTPASFVDEPVMEPAELEEVGELVFAAVNPMTDVVYVDGSDVHRGRETTALWSREVRYLAH